MPTAITYKYDDSYTHQTYVKPLVSPTPIRDPATGIILGYIPGTSQTVVNNTDGKYAVVTKTKVSAITPGWNSKNRSSIPKALAYQLIVNESRADGFSHDWCIPTSVLNGPGTSNFTEGTIFFKNSFVVGSVADETASWIDAISNKATRKLLTKIRDQTFNAAIATAERAQTAELFSSTATRVAKSITSLRRGNFVKAAQDLGLVAQKRAGRRFKKQFAVDQSKAIGNAWLELQYGWKPLLSDVYGSMELLATTNTPLNTIYKKVSTWDRRFAKINIQTKNNVGSYVGYSTITRKGEQSVSYRTGCTFSKTSPPLKTLQSVGITNPLLVVWEKIPYSFVVDWFLPIGNYLESLDATHGLEFYDGYRSSLRKFDCHSSKDVQYNNGYLFTYQWNIEDYKTVNFTRSVMGSFPLAPLPRFKNPISTSHVSSAIALLLQLKK